MGIENKTEYQTYREQWQKAITQNYTPPQPLNVDIELSSICNLRCNMCHQVANRHLKRGIMSLNIAQKAINQCARYKVPSIKFNWRGESILNRHLPELIRYAKDKDILEVQLNTNGNAPFLKMGDGIMEYNILTECYKAGLDRIIFSVDAVSENVYKQIRIGGNMDLLNKNRAKAMEYYYEHGTPMVRHQYVKQELNLNEMFTIEKICRKNNYDYRISNVMDRLGNGQFKLENMTSSGRCKCPQPFQRLTIGYDGKIMPCCVDIYESYCLGNILTDDLMDIWNSQQLNFLRNKLIENKHDEVEMCENCFCKESYIWK